MTTNLDGNSMAVQQEANKMQSIGVFMQIFDFTSEELAEMHRTGKMTPGHYSRSVSVVRQKLNKRFVNIAFPMVFLVIIVVILSIYSADLKVYFLTGYRIIFILSALAFQLWGLVSILRMFYAININSVSQISGLIEGQKQRKWRSKATFSISYIYTYSMNDDLEFDVSEHAYNALQKDQLYRVYYLTNTDFIVAVEPISDIDQNEQSSLSETAQTGPSKQIFEVKSF